ncbi:MAG: rRNA (uridine2552-2-O)-methyltransferase [Thermoplasmata archaeon]|jgi:23S rRNA (uridine2552-2'-O)-methyltransferase|nr:rRNA (uridine2552-2-O)-methyltransferase [Thermoplasmata archaeon]
MSRKWLRERSKDFWYKLAKKEGWRTRASFKLMQIDEKFDLFFEGARVVDLGAAPGGWSQVAVELVGPEGKVVGVDLDRIEPMEGVTFLRGDMTQPDTVARTMEACGGVADVVISDMSPNISGAYATDHARSIHLCEMALDFAGKVLVRDGAFVCKVFEGDMFHPFLEQVRAQFRDVKVANPAASRAASSEVYVVAQGFKGPGRYPPLAKPAEWEEGDELPASRKERKARG